MIVALPPPGTAATPAPKSDIAPEGVVGMLPGMCPEARLPPTTVVSRRDGSMQRTPEHRLGAPAKEILDRVWAGRARLSGVCLEYAAYAAAKMGLEDRALHLLAIGEVREAYDRARCVPPDHRGYSLYGDMQSIGQMMLSTDVALLRQRAAVWVPLAKAAAQEDATYLDEVDLAKVCDLSTPRPASEWPAARNRVAATFAALPTPSAVAAPATAPPPRPAGVPPSPPAPSGSRSPHP